MNAVDQPTLAVAGQDAFASCEREPIHTPGSIQPHGILLAACMQDLCITHLSGNFEESTGLSARGILGTSLSSVLGQDACTAILAALDSESYAPANALVVNIPFPKQPRRNVLAHRIDDVLVVEIEDASLAPEQETSLYRAHVIIQGLRRASSLEQLCNGAVNEIRSLTGYDRVMIYRFTEAGHGQVIAEDMRADQPSYFNLYYPASDIPPQARRLYLLQRVRTIVDMSYRPVPILVAPDFKGESTLDMTLCGLRSVSPAHIEYMHNMGVGATLGISLIRDGQLWGMVVCHHLEPRKPSTAVRSLCDVIGQLLSLLIVQVAEGEKLKKNIEQQKLLQRIGNSLDSAPTVMQALRDSADDLMQLVHADGALIRLGGQQHMLGRVPEDAAKVACLIKKLHSEFSDEPITIEALGELHPEFRELSDVASGLLFLPLANNPGDAIIWFRGELARTVEWAGDPNKSIDISLDTGRVSPRKSFRAWREVVRGHSLPWAVTDQGAALDLRRLISSGLLHNAEAHLARLSIVDPLTGLANRRALDGRIALWQAGKANTAAMLILFDLNRFKNVNDSLGHAAGDELLMQVAQRIGQSIPPQYIYARLGGDEFVVFGDSDAVANAEDIAKNILAMFDEAFVLNGEPYRASTSIGIAVTSNGSGKDILREADAAMYASKRQGGSTAVFFDETHHKIALDKLEVEQDLFLALTKKEFRLVYQALVEVSTKKIYGFEALIRWEHSRRGWISPVEFIPRAEQTGLIIQIGDWVLGEAVRQAACWRRMGHQIVVSINVAALQLSLGDFASRVSKVLQSEDLPPEAICIEITEGTLMDTVAIQELERVRDLGIAISLDDFGTGYSSLSYLRALPVDIIKIDRSFVTPLGNDKKASQFFRAIVGLIQTIELKVLAEGVETELQWQELKDAGCNAAQGYLFSKPVSAANATLLLDGPAPHSSLV
ncbi:EAL domain-containing protein [Massilia sp. RP-1-19]|uniref:EAL domain-containing protein n=1 Tax=Massilia polaris TaxID=2728846 RepID=A0A848HPX5_9BURK|nr:EAL domain-containing protein [Massilia polaris]NML63392.1 EAL domain-containing protein [Massilia polaris]